MTLYKIDCTSLVKYSIGIIIGTVMVFYHLVRHIIDFKAEENDFFYTFLRLWP